MHFEFKRKLNKVDSQKNRNFLVPIIDMYLNEAAELFVKNTAFPRYANRFGFELNQRIIDDIRTVVVDGKWKPLVNNVYPIDADYLFYIKGKAKLKKGTCPIVESLVTVRKYGEIFEDTKFYGSSYEWRDVNALFNENGIKFFPPENATIEEVKISYIRKMKYFHNAQDYQGGSYNHPSKGTLTGTVLCELPENTHREIVDIAVMLASSEVVASDFQLKTAKLGFNQNV